MKQATKVSEIRSAVSPEPLVDRTLFEQFYSERFPDRESDTTAALQLELAESHRGPYFRRFLTGHSGCGKSTELTRLTLALNHKFEFIRIMAQDELSPFSTQPFDLLHIMAIRAVEHAHNLGLSIPNDLLDKLAAWFSQVTFKQTRKTTSGAGAEASASAGLPKILSFLQLSATVKGEAKYSSDRAEEYVRQRLQSMSELRELVNTVCLEINSLLPSAKELVFLIEDLDKQSVSEAVLDTLFFKYANLWPELRVHFICTIPLWLSFGEKGANLRVERKVIVDIPVFDQNHQPHRAGRDTLAHILDKRVAPGLFSPGVKEFLIQAAGGNIRDMFAVTAQAATFAELAELDRVEISQATRAVNGLRNDYLRRLGETDPQTAIPYDKKAELLVKIYNDGQSVIQEPVLYRLLRSRVVHEYNDTYWYGLPPLMVDILMQQGRLPEGSLGALERPA